jgi:hypothetical protein
MGLQISRQMDEVFVRKHLPHSLSILKEAKAQNIPNDLEQIRSLIVREGDANAFSLIFCPDFISTFIASYLSGSMAKTILDCWAGMGEILSVLVKKFKPSVAIGINNLISEYEVAKLLHQDTTIDWRLGDPLLILDEINTKFNVVIGCPPFLSHLSSLTLTVENNVIELEDSWTNLIILKTALRLDAEGVGFFIVPPAFLKEQEKESSIYNNLERFGLFIDAVLYIPFGNFDPGAVMPGLLIIIKRKKASCLFVGELTSDLSNSNTLLKNLKARKTAKTPPHQGALVELTSFRSFPKLVAQYDIERSVKDLGLLPIPISQLCTTINFFTSTQTEEFSDLPNAVYLPITRRKLTVYSLASLNIQEQQDYIQIVLNSEKAIAEYVANFLNTPLGHKIRELHSERTDRYIVQIRKSEVFNINLYLPEPEVQRKIIGIKSVITNLSTEIEALEKQLWNYPQKYKETQKAVSLLNHVDNFEAWLESLPFPLASILWVYHADDNAKDKVDHLFHFFEALSQFICIVMLSSYAADSNFYNEESVAWINLDPKYKGWELTPSFASWIHLGRNLAKATRRLKDDKTKQERLLEAFGKPESDFLKMLTDKKLFNELDEICKYRNEWKGHGGATNSKENEHRLTLLESSLARVRQIISDRWETSLMLCPGSCKYSEEIYKYEVSALLGTKTTFKKQIVQTLVPMDEKKLYILHKTQQRPVEVLPFIRLMESPKTQQIACYFYNRTSNENIRWVSYYFSDDAEIIRPGTEMQSALSLLRAKDELDSRSDELKAVRAENQRLHIELGNSESEKESLKQQLAEAKSKLETEGADRE